MKLSSTTNALADVLLSLRVPPELIQGRVHQIHQDLLAHSQYVRRADFTAIDPGDIALLFGAYDERFFGGHCSLALNGRKLAFRLSRRMSSAGGKTTRYRSRTGEVSYEIAAGTTMLFESFGRADRRISVCGLECENRLEALQRIFEHELVHLTELLCWEISNCAADRFQSIAQRLFLHQAHTHSLITRRERAAVSGIRPGSRVTFEFEGQRLAGRVNRITKRATVLVEDNGGLQYSDGLRYQTYYVPIGRLSAVTETR